MILVIDMYLTNVIILGKQDLSQEWLIRDQLIP